MNNFFENTDDGLSLVIDDRGERVPLHSDMRLNFSNVAGAKVWIEHCGDRITCSARTPESSEPLLWQFKVSGPSVKNLRAPTPLQSGSTLKSAIENARVQLNGRW